MKVSFQLSDDDLKHFRKVMREVRARSKSLPEEEIIAATRELLAEMDSAGVPDFISERIGKLEQLVDMLEDEEWGLKGRDRDHVIQGITYFAEPEDMIPDKVPVLGFLDDAIMVELVVRELEAEIEAYTDFCEFRARREERFGEDEDPATREEWVVSRRKQLHQRIRRRRGRRRKSGAPVSGQTRIALW
jgi:uncharacterized membrane protein YkvA (DUF1232 family)